MRGIYKFGAMIGLAFAMSACATTRPYNHIDAGARPLIQDIDGVLISSQDQVAADIKTSKLSKYIQGHFAPVLFDLALNGIRSHKANKLIAPIHDTLASYDMNEVIEADFNEALANSNLNGLEELDVLRQEQRGFRLAYIRQSEADAVMFIDVKYAFTPSFDALNLTSRVMVFPVNPALSPYKEKPNDDHITDLNDNIYRNQFTASVPVGIDGKTSENGAVWAEMSEEKLTGLLQKASQKLAAHIAHDLSLDDVPEEEEEAGAETLEFLEQAPENITPDPETDDVNPDSKSES